MIEDAYPRDRTAFVKNSMGQKTLTGGKGGRMRHPPPPVRVWKLPGIMAKLVSGC